MKLAKRVTCAKFRAPECSRCFGHQALTSSTCINSGQGYTGKRKLGYRKFQCTVLIVTEYVVSLRRKSYVRKGGRDNVGLKSLILVIVVARLRIINKKFGARQWCTIIIDSAEPTSIADTTRAILHGLQIYDPYPHNIEVLDCSQVSNGPCSEYQFAHKIFRRCPHCEPYIVTRRVDVGSIQNQIDARNKALKHGK